MDKTLEAFIMKVEYDTIQYTHLLTHKTSERLH